jgi:hypothetical protein
LFSIKFIHIIHQKMAIIQDLKQCSLNVFKPGFRQGPAGKQYEIPTGFNLGQERANGFS